MNTPVPPKNLKAVPLNLPEHRDAFYGGEWHKPKSGHYADAINPGTGESLGPFADGGAADIDAAVGAAKKAFEGWRNTPPFERARLLKRVANVLREQCRGTGDDRRRRLRQSGPRDGDGRDRRRQLRSISTPASSPR